MKKLLLSFLVIFVLLLGTKTTCLAQTSLSAGDVVILEFNGNDTDGFTFMPLVDLSAGTVIHFTDYGWNGTAIWTAEEGTTIPPGGQGNMITYTAPSAITAGTLIRQNTANVGGSAFTEDLDFSSYNWNHYNFIGALNSLNSGHDGILVFQGSASSPTFIWAYHTGQWGQGEYANYYWSDLPTGLTNGTNAVYFPDLLSGTDLTVDDGYYSGDKTAADAATWRSRVANSANWTTSASGTAPTLLYPGTYTVTPAVSTPSGTGTAGDPYLISNLDELNWIAASSSRWGYYYTQTADIDASGTSSWNSGAGLATIGDDVADFIGTYDGQGHTISGLHINLTARDYVGLFGSITGATIKNLGLINASVTGKDNVGALVGYSYLSASSINNCFSTGSVSGNNYIGGLIGYSDNSTDFIVSNCYSHCSVASGQNAGGLIGDINNEGTVTNCYSAGSVSGTDVGGLIGLSNITVTHCFWDTQTTGQSSSAGGGTGKTTAEMQTKLTFTDATWDFIGDASGSDDWDINSSRNSGYPFLSYQYPVAPEINVQGNSINIADGNVTPSTTDDTDFGSLSVSSGTTVKTFTIQNAGSAIITLGTDAVSLTGDADFTVTSQPSTTIAIGSSTTFSITFDAAATGTRSAEVNITNDDSDENPYTFAIQGAGTPAGSGASSDPYLISNLDELRWVAEQTNGLTAGSVGFSGKYFKQTADIDASPTSTWFPDGSGGYYGWTPIGWMNGSDYVDFGGNYDGQNHTISNLYINRTNTDEIGLFGGNNGGSVTNLGIINISFAGKQNAGMFGYIYGGCSISNCYSTGTITATGNYVGGLVGIDDGSTSGDNSITQCYSSCAVSGVNYIGGLIGNSSGTDARTISDCHASGSVTATGTDAIAGGLIGYIDKGTISVGYATGNVTSTNGIAGGFIGTNYSIINSCFASGNITGKTYVGGFLGTNGGTTISNCYSSGSVSESGPITNYVGGFTGSNSGTISKCYTVSSISGTINSANKGGFVGFNNIGTINNDCFWNADIYLTGYALNNGTFSALSKTTLVMQTSSTYTDEGWDFRGEMTNGTNDYWDRADDKNSGYPFLSWQYPAVAPTVTTQAVSSISTTTATGNGNITALGSLNPTAYGVCWNTTGTPTISDNKTDKGAASATGTYTSAITSLLPNTTYYAKAYATNTAGTSYGSEVSFTTLPVAPTVTTQAVSSIGSTTATGNGNITDLGAPNPTQYGVVWSTSTNPTVALTTKTSLGAIASTGAFTSSITGLSANMTYYVKAYATNTTGTSYGSEVSFTTKTPGLWTGATDNDWNTGSNWDDGNVPTSTVDVTIPDVVNDPVIGATANCQSITINSSAVLTVSASQTLNIYGNFTNNGTYTANGTTAFKKTSAQTITGNTTFADMLIENKLIVASGTKMTVNPGATLRFKTGVSNFGILEIQGQLTADGTSGNEITFTRDGSSGNWGIVLFNSITASSSLTHCTFAYGGSYSSANPPGTFSGVISFYQSSNVTVENCDVSNNGSAGFYIYNYSSPNIYNNIMINNGNPLGNGRGITVSYNSSPNIIGNTISGNNSRGIACYTNSNPVIKRNTIKNSIGTFGDGILCSGSAPTIKDNLIFGNSKPGVNCSSSSPLIINNTIVNNTEQGIYLTGGSSPVIINTIIFGNNGTGEDVLIDDDASNPAFSYSDVEGGYAAFAGIGAGANYDHTTRYTKNINADPLFTDAGNSDYTITATSPCVNTGDPFISGTGTDLAGNSRIIGGRIDIGAFEVQCTNPTSGGTIAANQTGCNPFNPAEITSSALPTGHSGTLEYKWQSSITSSSNGFSDIVGSNAATYDPGPLTVDIWFKRLSRVDCMSDWIGAAESNVLKMTVYALPTTPTAGSNSYTYDGTLKTASVNVESGETVDWYASSTGTTTVSALTGTNAGTYSAYAEARNTTTGCVSSSRTLITLEISKATLTVTADNQTKVYGDVNPELTFQYSGWVNDEDESVLTTAPTATTTVTVTSPVDDYTNAITISGGVDDNYSFTYVAADFEVTKATLFVTANDKTKVYGRTNPNLTFTYSGWVNGVETIDTPPTISTRINETSRVGTYDDAITLTGGSDNNYTLNLIAGDFKVTRAKLTITAKDQSKCFDGKVYAGDNSVIFSGFVNGEDQSNLGGSLTFTGAFAEATPPGNYAIVPGGLTSSNYNIVYLDGNLTIRPLPTAKISGDEEICAGSSATIDVVLTGEAPWTVTVFDGTKYKTVENISKNLYTFDVTGDAGMSKTYTITEVSDFSGCSSTGEGSVTVTVRSHTFAGEISGDQLIAPGTVPAPIVSVSPGSGEGTITYIWQSSVDQGTNWEVIPEVTSETYLPEIPEIPIWFRRIAITTKSGVSCSAVTEPVKIKIWPTGIIDNESATGLLKAFAVRNTAIHIKGDVSQLAVARLYDIQGRLILVKNLQEGSLNVIQTNIRTGIYLLVVKDGERSQEFKIPVRE